MTEEKEIRLWGWVMANGKAMTSDEFATKACPLLNTHVIPHSQEEDVPLEFVKCQTTNCVAFMEREIGGEKIGRCSALHGSLVNIGDM